MEDPLKRYVYTCTAVAYECMCVEVIEVYVYVEVIGVYVYSHTLYAEEVGPG